jgi:hypothetical protein
MVQVLSVIAPIKRADQGFHAALPRSVALQARHKGRYKLLERTARLLLRQAEPLTDLLRCSATARIH